jgi:hypothetical protein
MNPDATSKAWDEINRSAEALKSLCEDIRSFLATDIDHATYTAPVIDFHHPDDYRQKGIAGLRKYLNHAETERDYVISVRSVPLGLESSLTRDSL